MVVIQTVEVKHCLYQHRYNRNTYKDKNLNIKYKRDDTMEPRTFTYISEFEPVQVITKGEKHYYLEGYFSTIDKDLSLETVTKSAQMDILDQVMNRTITVDAEHEVFYDDKGNPKYKPSSAISLGKVVYAEMRTKGVWGKVELNPHIERFENIWKSALKGFVNAFSVAFIPLQAVKKKVNGIMESFVERLNLVNITITGNPMNPAAGFIPTMKSAANLLNDTYLENKEESLMSTKTIKKSEEDKESKEAKEMEELKKKADDDDEELTEEEKKKLKKKAEDEEAEKEKEALKKKADEEEAEKDKEEKVKTKTMIEQLEAKLKTLESKVTVLEAKPIMKSKIDTQPKIDASNGILFSAFNYIK